MNGKRLQNMADSAKMNGPRGATNTFPALEHSEPDKEVRHMSHYGHYGDSTPSDKREFKPLTAERLRSVLEYCPDRGLFFWKVDHRNRQAGSLAGSKNGRGYWQITVDGKCYLAHRLAWLYSVGVWPGGVVDHINGDQTDNRIANLRDVSIAVNLRNRRSNGINRKADGSGWRATAGGGYVGFSKCLGKAIALRDKARRQLEYGPRSDNWKSIGQLARRLVENAK